MLYMVTFTIFYHQYTPHVSIYTSTMDPMGMVIIRAGLRLCRGWIDSRFFSGGP